MVKKVLYDFLKYRFFLNTAILGRPSDKPSHVFRFLEITRRP